MSSATVHLVRGKKSRDTVLSLFAKGHDTAAIAAKLKNTTEAAVYNTLARAREDARAQGSGGENNGGVQA